MVENTRAARQRLFPAPVLFGGVELASSVNGEDVRAARVVQVVTAGTALWNPGVAYLVGLLLHHADRRGVVRLGDSS